MPNRTAEIHNNEEAILAYTSLKSAWILFADSTLRGNKYIGCFDKHIETVSLTCT
jgi:hypothetical protein